MAHIFTFTADIREHDGPSAWHFVALPPDHADDIAALVEGRTKAFGSVRVTVRIGTTEWSTSLFPDKAHGTYVLPVKRSVRTAEAIPDGDACEVGLHVLTEEL